MSVQAYMSRGPRRDRAPWHRHCTSAVLCILLLLAAGCSRALYREQADADAYSLIQSKTCSPRWPLDGYTIDIDPASRMFDPGDPDHPPMPPDDPSAHQLMHCVDCKHGYPHWHANGDTPYVANPYWMASLPRGEDGSTIIDADSAVSLALLHSADYQEELETLYLSALDVSFERFRFDTQFFGGTSLFFTADGRDRSVAGGDSSSLLDLSTFSPSRNLEARRLFSSGGELVVGLANSLIWQFSGPNTNTATTLLDFSLVQPLLRGGGRDQVLERLTISERALLANVRQMERFRRGFYVEVVTGRDAGPGPNRRGGFFGGAGLEGFTGVGGGGFGQVGGAVGGTRGGAGAAQAGGFLGLLQDQQDIRNQSANIAALQSSVLQLESLFLASRIDFFQVELARQALFNAQSRLLNSELDFQRSLDQYKATLGLPPQVELSLDQRLIDPFQLIDSQIVALQNRLTDVQRAAGRTILEIIEQAEQTPALPDGPVEANAAQPQLDWNDQMVARLSRLQDQLGKASGICDTVTQDHVPRAREDLVRLRSAIQDRQRDMTRLSRRFLQRLRTSSSPESAVDVGPEQLQLLPFDREELQQLPDVLDKTLDDLIRRYEAEKEQLSQLHQDVGQVLDTAPNLQPIERYKQLREKVLAPVPNALTELSADILGLTLVQARARTQSVRVVPTDMTWQNAVEIARTNRRDWMNARASLVDSWRLVQFNADDLESQLDIVVEGDISNVGDNPLDFRDTTGRLRLGAQFDAPLTRLSERNVYRQALIEYQQARRNYYEFADQIAAVLRNSIRTMDVNQLNFELRRVAVEVAIAQVELTRLRLQEPPKPEAVAQFGATTARDLVTALNELLTAQNDFLSVWINQEVLRRSLDFDMGTMQLDVNGIWLDPGSLLSDPRAVLETDELLKQSSQQQHGMVQQVGPAPRPVPTTRVTEAPHDVPVWRGVIDAGSETDPGAEPS